MKRLEVIPLFKQVYESISRYAIDSISFEQPVWAKASRLYVNQAKSGYFSYEKAIILNNSGEDIALLLGETIDVTNSFTCGYYIDIASIPLPKNVILEDTISENNLSESISSEDNLSEYSIKAKDFIKKTLREEHNNFYFSILCGARDGKLVYGIRNGFDECLNSNLIDCVTKYTYLGYNPLSASIGYKLKPIIKNYAENKDGYVTYSPDFVDELTKIISSAIFNFNISIPSTFQKTMLN